MAERDILDQIDDVIHWDGRSPDAMRWTADPPVFDRPPVPHIDPEQARRFLVSINVQAGVH